MKFDKLDPLLHSQLRLAVISILISIEKADFSFLKEQTEATSGNLSVHLDKLDKAGYLTIKKGYDGKIPQTTYTITKKGSKAFEKYAETLKGYLNNS